VQAPKRTVVVKHTDQPAPRRRHHHDRPAHHHRPARRRRGHTAPAARAAAAITGVAALIAAGGYLATTTIGPDSIPTAAPTGPAVNPSAQTLSELRESVAGQYGSQSATPAPP
jgi:hypothetical protein